MEIRTLRYFLAVAEEESMTKAAELLHVTQPTLSRQLNNLEGELGKELFHRLSHGMKLTAAGRLLKERAAVVVSMADKIVAEFSSFAEVRGGDLYLGLAESYRIRRLAEEIRILKERFPDLRYHITSGDTEQVTDKLDAGLLDFAVLAEPPNFNKYNALTFPEADVWGLVIPAADPLAAKAVITFDDLLGLPLFCSEQGWKYDIAKWSEGRTDQLQLEGSFRLAYNASLFAKEGLGYLLTFARLVDTSADSGLVFRPLFPVLETDLYLIWKRSATFSPMAEAFLTHMREALR